MAELIYETKHQEVLDAMLLGLPGVRADKMFGYSAHHVDDQLFTCAYGPGVGVKVPEDFAAGLT